MEINTKQALCGGIPFNDNVELYKSENMEWYWFTANKLATEYVRKGARKTTRSEYLEIAKFLSLANTGKTPLMLSEQDTLVEKYKDKIDKDIESLVNALKNQDYFLLAAVTAPQGILAPPLTGVTSLIDQMQYDFDRQQMNIGIEGAHRTTVIAPTSAANYEEINRMLILGKLSSRALLDSHGEILAIKLIIEENQKVIFEWAAKGKEALLPLVKIKPFREYEFSCPSGRKYQSSGTQETNQIAGGKTTANGGDIIQNAAKEIFTKMFGN